jgi:carbonic anhydrase
MDSQGVEGVSVGMSRRDLLMGGVGAVCGCLGGLAATWRISPGASSGPAAEPSPTVLAAGSPSAQQSLEWLIAGNTRFATGNAQHPHMSREWRAALVHEQHPYAVILGCSDSRVSPEVIFDEGLGELFVVRQAGHVADDDSLGSVEYAVGHLHIPLVVVLGHQGCGAVEAAVGAVLRDEAPEGHILRLVDDITPAVHAAQSERSNLVDAAIRANIRHVVHRLRSSGPVLRPRERRGELRVVGAYYSLNKGVVEWLPN